MDVGFDEEEQAEILEKIAEVLKSGYLMWGPMQEQLQAAFCVLTRREYAVTFNSNTSAQEAWYTILYQERGPRVVAFLGNTFPSPTFAALRAGHLIRFVDVAPLTMTPTIAHLEEAMPFHVLCLQETAGWLPDAIINIRDWCRSYGILLLEDCAHSIGAEMPTKEGGSWVAGQLGDAAVFSLAGTKPMTTGQGGVIVTDDPDVAEKLFQLKNYGRTEMFQKGEFVQKGWNTHMTELQAAVGCVAIRTMPDRVVARRALAAIYDERLKGSGFVRCGGMATSWYKYPVLMPEGVTRAGLRLHLLNREIELGSAIYEKAAYDVPALVNERKISREPRPELKGIETWTDRHACLPMHNKLTPMDVALVADAVLEQGKVPA